MHTAVSALTNSLFSLFFCSHVRGAVATTYLSHHSLDGGPATEQRFGAKESAPRRRAPRRCEHKGRITNLAAVVDESAASSVMIDGRDAGRGREGGGGERKGGGQG